MSREVELPPRIKDLLAGADRRWGLENPAASAGLWSRWQDIVGEHVAAHAEPTSLKGGVLRIRTESPVWATEIGYLAAQIKERVAEVVGPGVVTDVVVWTGPGDGRDERRHARGAARGATTDGTGTRRAAGEPGPKEPAEALSRARRAWERRRSRRS